MTKPGDFFVGVVDLFSILLPGAMLAYLSMGFVEAASLGLPPIARGGVEGWIAFVLVAYVFGHFLFVVGGFFEELLDPVERWEELKWSKRDRSAEQVAGKRMCAALRSSLGTEVIGPVCDGEKCEERLVRRMIKSSLRVQSPVAAAELDRLEAVSKFFRSFSFVMLIFFVSLLTFHRASVFATWGRMSVVLLILPGFLFGSLALYIYQAGRRNNYVYIYYLVQELGAKGGAKGAEGGGGV